MKDYFSILGIALAVIALGLTGIAFATPAHSAEPLTIAHSWRIEHDNLLREFSQGLGVDLAGRKTAAALAKSEHPAAGARQR